MRTPQVVFGNDFINLFLVKSRRDKRELGGFVSSQRDGPWEEMRVIGKPFGERGNDNWHELARVGYNIPPLPAVLGYVSPEKIGVRPLVDSEY